MCTRYELNTRITEIAQMLEDGKPRAEVVKTSMEKWGVSARTVVRYLVFAYDIVSKRMDERDAVMDASRAEIIAKLIENQTMLSTLELEAKLCKIADGNTEIERTVHTRTGIEKVLQKPNCSEILRAIDKLLKMRGCYDPKEKKLVQPGPRLHLTVTPQQKEIIDMI